MKRIALIFFLGSYLYAQDPQALFQEKCSLCHTLGQGDKLGPDLIDVGKKRDRAWIEGFIRDPEGFKASHPEAQKLSQAFDMDMPNLGLSSEEIQLLADFLLSAGTQTPSKTAQPAAQKTLSPGDKDRGKALFLGWQAFQKGAPPCITCHSFKGWGPFGGGKLGKPLKTNTINSAILLSPPFPTMKPIFQAHPLTDQEVADLLAFFNQPQEAPSPFSFALAGVLLLFVGIGLAPFIKKA